MFFVSWYIYIPVLFIVQLVVIAYRWRSRTQPLPFVLGSLIALGAWAALLLFMPYKSHAVKLDMPLESGGNPVVSDALVSVIAMAVGCLLLIGINQLILFAIRAVVNRITARGRQ